MPPTTYIFAKGTRLQRQDPSTLLYADIVQCTILNTPPLTFDEEEISNHSSPGNAKEFAQTMFDPGSIPVTLIWTPSIALHVQLYADMVNNVNLNWKIILPNVAATTFSGPGFLRNFGGPLEFNKVLRMSGEIRCSSLWTLV